MATKIGSVDDLLHEIEIRDDIIDQLRRVGFPFLLFP